MIKHNHENWTNKTQDHKNWKMELKDSYLGKRESPPTDSSGFENGSPRKVADEFLEIGHKLDNIFTKVRMILREGNQTNSAESIIKRLEMIDSDGRQEKLSEFYENEQLIQYSPVSFQPCLGVYDWEKREPIFKALEEQAPKLRKRTDDKR